LLVLLRSFSNLQIVFRANIAIYAHCDPDFKDQPGNENEEDLSLFLNKTKNRLTDQKILRQCRALVVIPDKFSETTMVYAASRQ